MEGCGSVVHWVGKGGAPPAGQSTEWPILDVFGRIAILKPNCESSLYVVMCRHLMVPRLLTNLGHYAWQISAGLWRRPPGRGLR